jgi:Ca2+/Na+ antiporter
MWFDYNTGIIIGTLLGSLFGILGGLWGAFAGIYARKGKYKKLILSYAIILIGMSFISLCTGIVALLSKQPFYVWYPMVLVGFTITVTLTPSFFLANRIYINAELKRMSLDDIN